MYSYLLCLLVYKRGWRLIVCGGMVCYLQHVQKLHVSVQQDKRNQVLDLIQSVYETSLSVCVRHFLQLRFWNMHILF